MNLWRWRQLVVEEMVREGMRVSHFCCLREGVC